MGQVAVTLNGRTYRLKCGDGEEQRLHMLVEHVRDKIDDLANDHGQIGNERLLLMTSIMIADELFGDKYQAPDAPALGEAWAEPGLLARLDIDIARGDFDQPDAAGSHRRLDRHGAHQIRLG